MKDVIIDVLAGHNEPLSLIEINDLLKYTNAEELTNLQQELDNLFCEGKVHKTKKNKYMLIDHCSSLVTGVIHINKRGHGYVDIKDGNDIFVDKRFLNGAVDSDLVEVDIQNNKSGVIVNILKRELNILIGEIVIKNNKMVFELDDKKKDLHIEITKESISHCVEGHKVLVKIIKELKKNYYLGEVTKIIGHKNDPGVDILTIAAKYEIELEFNDAVKKQVNSLETSVTDKDLAGRKDLRGECIFTIDGDDTKDIDDAISIDKKGDNYLLGVHIADVSYYVKEGSPLFESAFEKGTSSYLADTVLPMLPHELSNGICSLNEHEDRLTISCEMEIDKFGKVVDYDIFLSVINSKKKMTYNNVNKVIMDGFVPLGYEEFSDKLLLMKELSNVLRREKINRGYIDFGLDEAKIVQDETGKAIDVVKRVRGDGEKIIEDFMICANETVATHISNMDLPFIYRVHDIPRSEKIDDFLNLVKIMGYKISVNTNDITPKTMQNILLELDDKDEFPILSDMLLRSMKKAIYSSNNIGHFGLASKIYTHFTSPIRRFPDLVVHTLLHKYLFEKKIDRETLSYYEKMNVIYADRASEREQAAIEAEREVLDMKKAEYMLDHINEEYDGIITGVTNFGMFVALDNLVEGLVHISSLKGFYNYVPELLSLVSNNNIKYTIGDKVKVKVVSANKDLHTVDFELVSDDGN